MIVFRYFAHCLELAINDAFKSTFFSAVDELLLRVYYLYKNSPKKCHELNEAIAALRLCLEPGDLPREVAIGHCEHVELVLLATKLQPSAG